MGADQSEASVGLTTNAAPYILQQRAQSRLYIDQPYDLYTPENHESWQRLYARQAPMWDRYANSHFQKGIASLRMDQGRVPRLSDINAFLCPLTGFRAKPVSGYIPAFRFFDCLRRREFPTTITIRDGAHLDYLPEPDIFHDIAGHVPMHTDPDFAEALVRFGDCAHTASEIVREMADEHERLRVLTSILKAMARFFWFTVEFGLMSEGRGLKVYGSGLLSSHSEIEHAVDSADVQRYPARLEWLVNQQFEIDHFQPLLFVVESFGALFAMVDELERCMRDGKLSNVAPGEPHIGEADLESFLAADRVEGRDGAGS